MVKDHNADKDHEYGDHPRQAVAEPRNRTLTEHGIAEDLNGSRYGIDLEHRLHKTARKLRHRVNYRCRVHPELNAKGDNDREVAVFGGKAGYDDSATE